MSFRELLGGNSLTTTRWPTPLAGRHTVVSQIPGSQTPPHQGTYPSICRGLRKAGLQIAARTYREWTSPQRVVAARTVSDAEVEDTVRKLVWQPDGQGRRKMQPAGLYGRRKMLAEVHRAGLTTASPGAVDRVMRTLGLSGVLRSKKVYTTSSDPDGVRAPDLVDRNWACQMVCVS